MPITVSMNAKLGLHVIRFDEEISLEQLRALAALHQSRPDWAAADTMYIVDESADVSGLTKTNLDELRLFYRTLYQSLDFYMMRRAAWACHHSAKARPMIEYWLDGRHSRDEYATEVCVVASLEDASPLFCSEEIDAVVQQTDFVEIVQIGALITSLSKPATLQKSAIRRRRNGQIS